MTLGRLATKTSCWPGSSAECSKATTCASNPAAVSRRIQSARLNKPSMWRSLHRRSDDDAATPSGHARLADEQRTDSTAARSAAQVDHPVPIRQSEHQGDHRHGVCHADSSDATVARLTLEII